MTNVDILKKLENKKKNDRIGERERKTMIKMSKPKKIRKLR